jgi:hypothetical protein
MRTKQGVIVLLILFVSGCGGDPKTSRLHMGQDAVIDGAAGSSVTAFPQSSENILKGSKTISLPVGTQVKVHADDGPDGDGSRLIKVTPWEGEYAMKTLDIRRDAVRPGKK